MLRPLSLLLFGAAQLAARAQGMPAAEQDARERFRMLYDGFLAMVHQQPDSALALARAMEGMAGASGNARWQAYADQCMGQAWSMKGHPGKALLPYQRALTGFERQGDAPRAAMVHANIANILVSQRQWEQARHHGEQAVAELLRTGQPVWAAAAREELAQAYLGLGMDDSARVQLERAAPVLDQPGLRGHADPLRQVEAGLFLLHGEVVRAEQVHRALRNDTTVLGTGILRARILLDMGRALATIGMPLRADTILRAALAESRQGGFDMERMEAHKALADLLAGQGRPAEALVQFTAWAALRDSIASAATTLAIAGLQQRFQAARKDAAMERQRATIARQRTGLLALVALVTLLGVGALAMVRGRRRQQRHLRELTHGNTALGAALEEKDLLMRELHHRVKNNLQLVGSLLRMQGRAISDPAAREAVREGHDRVRSMALIHQDLYRADDLRGIAMRPYTERLVRGLLDSHGISADRITVVTEVEDLRLDVDTAVPIGLILNELFVNALKHAFPQGRQGTIRVTLSRTGGGLFLEVADDGVGHTGHMGGEGFGLGMLQAFAAKLKARYEMNGSPGTAVRFILNDLTPAP